MLQNTLFIEDAEEDLEHFLKSDQRKRVLIFPPVNNYRRFLIHQLVQDRYSDLLQTFSIGQGFSRRTVVCYQSDYIGAPKVNGILSQTDDIVNKKFYTMGIENQCTPTTSPDHNNKTRQVKSTPAYEIYRPPAARRARLEKSPATPATTEQTIPEVTRTTRPKRPDRAVYVPRHRRSVPDINVSNASLQDMPSKLPKEVQNTTSKSQTTMVTCNDITTEIKPTNNENKKTITEVVCTETDVEVNTDAVESEGHISFETAHMDITEESLYNKIILNKNTVEQEQKYIENPVNILWIGKASDERDRRKTSETIQDPEMSAESQSKDLDTKYTNLIYDSDFDEEAEVVIKKADLISKDCKDKKNIEKSENTVRKALVSKVLVISSKENDEKSDKTLVTHSGTPMTPPEKKVKKIERPKSKPAVPPAPPLKINRDECDWDSLFDDNGDCLDPTLIEELTSSVGEVVIEKPKSNYKSVIHPVEVSNDEFAHVVEIYNFPSDFKSSDLAVIFNSFKSGGFELKWVDDTHCLGVFSSPLVAAEVLATQHPFVKTRPLSEATALSKIKVRKGSEFLQPYRQRPETCAALARRLVTKSLGVTLATARQEREQEKLVLKEAKEKRRLANKQREEIWEGIIAEK